MIEKNKSLKISLIFNIIYQVVNVLTPLIITPKLSRVFGADYLGVKSYSFSIVYYFAIFGVLGLDMYGQRKIALEKDDLEKRSKSFCTIYLTRFSLVVISTIIYIWYFTVFSANSFEKTVFTCWILYLVREMINPIWFLQGIERFKYLSVCEIVSQIAYVFCVLIFINEKDQLPLYILIFTSIPLLTSLLYFPIVLKNVIPIKIKLSDMVSVIRESFVYFVPTIATAIYSMVDKTMLGVFDAAKISTGLYESTEKLVKVALAISTSSFTIMRTRMSYIYGLQDKDKYSKYSHIFMSLSMVLCWPIMFGIMGIVQDFVPIFFGPGFEDVIGLSYVFALVVPCLTISGLLQAIYIFPCGLQKMMNLYYVLIVIVNIIMNLVLISLLGTIGAIISSVFAEFLLACILLYKARDIIDVKFLFYGSIKYFFSSVFMFVFMRIMSNLLNIFSIYKIVFEFTGAVIIYFSLCLLLKDEFVVLQVKNIIKRLNRYRLNILE